MPGRSRRLHGVADRRPGSGAAVTADTATVWTFEAGKVVRLALHWDGAAALEAVGAAGVGHG